MRISYLLLVVSIFILSIQLSVAQVKVEAGLKAGLNYSNLNNGPPTNPIFRISNVKPFVGYHVGGYASIKFTDFTIQPELLYSQQGQDFSYGSSSGHKTRINYVNVPIVFKYYPIGGFNIQLGPQVGFVASAHGDIYNSLTNQVANQSITGLIKAADFSVVFGAGWDLPSGISFAIRYNLGVTDISKYTGKSLPSGIIPNGGFAPLGTISARNQVFQLSVGYRMVKSFGRKHD